MTRLDRAALWALPLLILVMTLLGPAERSLGETARIIYIHGAMVWVALLSFAAAALISLAGLIIRRDRLYHWSVAAGRVALIFWIGYLPLSMWAARAAWGQVFLEDPSFQRAFRILAVSLIVQVVIWLLLRPGWLASLLNLVPFALVVHQLSGAEQFMHPDSPIRDAESTLIQVYFYALSALCALLAVVVGRCFLNQCQAEGD